MEIQDIKRLSIVSNFDPAEYKNMSKEDLVDIICDLKSSLTHERYLSKKRLSALSKENLGLLDLTHGDIAKLNAENDMLVVKVAELELKLQELEDLRMKELVSFTKQLEESLRRCQEAESQISKHQERVRKSSANSDSFHRSHKGRSTGETESLLSFLNSEPRDHRRSRLSSSSKNKTWTKNSIDRQSQFSSMEEKSATVDQLVERLVLDEELDQSFIKSFLLTYRQFSDKYTILQKLIDYFKSEDENSDVKSVVHLRVVMTLKIWLDNYFVDFEKDDEMLKMFEEFTSTISETFARKLENIMKKHLNHKNASRKNLKRDMTVDSFTFRKMPIILTNTKGTFSKSMSTMFGTRRNRIHDINSQLQDPLLVAQQLALLEHEMFKKIKELEMIDQAWMKKDKELKAPNIVLMTQLSNHVVKWVISEILEQSSLKNRVIVFEKFIQIAYHSDKLNNFNAVKEILAGLQSSSVHRLKKTREAICSKWSKVFEELCTNTSSDFNFKILREKIHSANPPLVPFPGVYLGDLVFLDTASSTVTKDGMVNFQKCQTLASYVMELKIYQQVSYSFEENPEVQAYITNYNTLSDDEAYELSLKIEPRENQ